jgi:hypothetical protein
VPERHAADPDRVPSAVRAHERAHTSWTLIGARSGIDPHGQGNPAEQAFCKGLR